MNTVTFSMTVNGKAAGPHVVPADLSMNDYLREYLGLTGTKFGCGIGECHACVIILDLPDGTSESIRTCITPADYFAGQKVRTVEGQAKDDQPTPVQAAFLDHFAFQCGYCTPASSTQPRCWWRTSRGSPWTRRKSRQVSSKQ